MHSRRWKLHLRPKRMASSHVTDNDIPPFPANFDKTAVEVLSDFMRYLRSCAQTFITDTHSESLWASVETNIDFVLTHPNGWEGAQQSEIRRAAVLAGLVDNTSEGQSRIQLLTEGEASLHYCIGNGVASHATTVGRHRSFISLHHLILLTGRTRHYHHRCWRRDYRPECIFHHWSPRLFWRNSTY